MLCLVCVTPGWMLIMNPEFLLMTNGLLLTDMLPAFSSQPDHIFLACWLSQANQQMSYFAYSLYLGVG